MECEQSLQTYQEELNAAEIKVKEDKEWLEWYPANKDAFPAAVNLQNQLTYHSKSMSLADNTKTIDRMRGLIAANSTRM
jgi:hypothetical protein